MVIPDLGPLNSLSKKTLIKKLNIVISGANKRSNKEFEVISGPYKSINLLKNDYIDIKNFVECIKSTIY